MKSIYSEDFYRTHWAEFLKPVLGEDYINLEGELETAMRVYRAAKIDEAALSIITKAKAVELADRCKSLVMREMQTVKKLDSGAASFGMRTQWQEREQRKNFIQRFEFNCLQLADFRKTHGV